MLHPSFRKRRKGSPVIACLEVEAVLTRMADILQQRLHELLPWKWQALRTQLPVAA